MAIDRDKDSFFRMATPALFASFSGVNVAVPADQVWRQAQDMSEKLWFLLQPFKDNPMEEFVWMRVVAVACLSNDIAHGKNLNHERAIINAIDKAILGWSMHTQWREKQS